MLYHFDGMSFSSSRYFVRWGSAVVRAMIVSFGVSAKEQRSPRGESRGKVGSPYRQLRWSVNRTRLTTGEPGSQQANQAHNRRTRLTTGEPGSQQAHGLLVGGWHRL